MSVVKINAITVPEDSGDELAVRFAARAKAIDGVAGFEGFELLRPTDGRNVWLVVMRWRDDAAFDAWVDSDAFHHAHRGTHGDPPGKPDQTRGRDTAPPKVGVDSQVWSFDIPDLDAMTRQHHGA
ncbi:MAG: antibiotic biosynthesis monooxygenase [Actinomycetales bacterium]|nr:MAG: antibiotic biosynthesis monooxygenase [Actinomycetales bacterium]